jgi:hypothetical protein
VLSFGKDDLEYFHGLKLTRTLSKLFIMDEVDERELVFAWEDKDTIIDQLNRCSCSALTYLLRGTVPSCLGWEAPRYHLITISLRHFLLLIGCSDLLGITGLSSNRYTH